MSPTADNVGHMYRLVETSALILQNRVIDCVGGIIPLTVISFLMINH